MKFLVLICITIGCSAEPVDQTSSVSSGETVAYDAFRKSEVKCHREYADDVCRAHIEASSIPTFCTGMTEERLARYKENSDNAEYRKLIFHPVATFDGAGNLTPKEEVLSHLTDSGCDVEAIIAAYDKHAEAVDLNNSSSGIGLR